MIERHDKVTAVALVALCVVLSACGSSSGSSARVSSSTSDFGSMKNVCHKAIGVNEAHSDRGVTASSITITTESDATSKLRPGLNQELWDASTVFTDWCNAHGGINGRRINMVKGDAQLTGYSQVVADACTNSFAMVGGGGVFDNTGQKQRVTCMLPAFPAFTGSATARGSALLYQALPSSNTQFAGGAMKVISDKYPSTLDHIGSVYGNVQSLEMYRDQMLQTGAKSYGWGPSISDMVYQTIGPASWAPTAKKLASKKVAGLVFTGEPSDLANLMIAVKSSGYKGLKWVYALSNVYDPDLIRLAGPALGVSSVYVYLYVVPFESADVKAPGTDATQQYTALFEKYLPDGKKRALLGVNSFSAWLLFAKAADACGTKLDRKCLVASASSIHSFDAGGLIGATDPGAGSPPRCDTLVQATPGGFKLVDVKANTLMFDCSDSNVTNLEDFNYQKFGDPPVALGDVGRSLGDLP